MGLIVMLIITGVIGWIASMIMKTDAQMSWVENVIAGLVGALIASLLIGGGIGSYTTLSLMGIVWGVAGACLAIWLWTMIRSR